MKDTKQLKEEYEKLAKPLRNSASAEGSGAVFRAWDRYKRAERRERKWKE